KGITISSSMRLELKNLSGSELITYLLELVSLSRRFKALS
ncbi:MAG: hypothetical protein ACI90A_001497, partial [Shewanella sp.]